MTENQDVSGRSEGAGDASDHDPWLAALRERALAHARATPQEWPRTLKISAIAIALLAHVLFGFWLASLMRQRPSNDDPAISVELLAAPPPEPELPVPPPAPARSVPTQAALAPQRPAQPREDAMSATIAIPAAPQPFSSAALFNPDGSVKLPLSKLTPHEKGMERGRELMQRGHNLLHCSRGRLQAYVSPEEASSAAAARRAMYLGMFHSPSDDPLLKGIAIPGESAAAGDAAAERERIKARACDDDVWQRPMPEPKRQSAQTPADATPG